MEWLLELGCGDGKQTKFLRKRFPHMRITSVDINEHALQCLPRTVTTRCEDMDTVSFPQQFHCVLAVYSFYYSKDMVQLARRAYEWLRPGGRLILIGPNRNNNPELDSLVAKAGFWLSPTEPFLSLDQAHAIQKDLYEHWTQETFENRLEFTAPEFMQWWRNHNSYIPDADAAVEAKLGETVQLTKTVCGFIFKKAFAI